MVRVDSRKASGRWQWAADGSGSILKETLAADGSGLLARQGKASQWFGAPYSRKR